MQLNVIVSETKLLPIFLPGSCLPFSEPSTPEPLIEYIGFKVIVPNGGYFKIMHSETFYEGNMIDEKTGKVKTSNKITFDQHSVIPLGRSGVYKTS